MTDPFQHIREICHFDLTLPMVGVGPKFVRKLLLEENLKMRGGKDSKVSATLYLPGFKVSWGESVSSL